MSPAFKNDLYDDSTKYLVTIIRNLHNIHRQNSPSSFKKNQAFSEKSTTKKQTNWNKTSYAVIRLAEINWFIDIYNTTHDVSQ